MAQSTNSSNQLEQQIDNEQQQQQPQQTTSSKAEPQANCQVLTNSKVADFYRDTNILITGASGFLGKVLLWKLLESCPNVGKIYVLLRSKDDLSAQKRLIQILKGKPFNMKYQYADLLKNIVAIESDMTLDGLGLSQSDRTLLEDEVNVVFHSAASVKFDAPLKDNMRDNVYGTRSIVELCNGVKNLKALVHVSTAYSNCQAREIQEDLLALERNVDDVVKIVE